MITIIGKRIYATVFGTTGQTALSDMKRCDGTVTSINVSSNFVGQMYQSPGYSAGGQAAMIVGSGDTEEQESDYCLESIITSISRGAIALTRTETSLVYTQTFSNGTGADMDINEVGIVCGRGSGVNDSFLAIRNVLEQTITLAHGESVTLSVEVNF